MTTVSISELKARLSAFLDIARHGEEVLVTDRGRPIARLTPVHGEKAEESRREMLVRSGRLRAPTAPLAADFWKRRRPIDATLLQRCHECLLETNRNVSGPPGSRHRPTTPNPNRRNSIASR